MKTIKKLVGRVVDDIFLEHRTFEEQWAFIK